MLKHRFLAVATFLAMFEPRISHAQSPAGSQQLPGTAYEHVFRHIRFLKQQDDAAAGLGRRSSLASYYKDLANLTQQQADALQIIALAAVVELEALDQQAQVLILRWWAQLPSSPPPGSGPPALPPELNKLKGARQAALASERGKLMQALGPEALGRLEQALIGNRRAGSKATLPASRAGHVGN